MKKLAILTLGVLSLVACTDQKVVNYNTARLDNIEAYLANNKAVKPSENVDKLVEEGKIEYSEEYLSLVKYSKGLIGNSSSGLIEVPSLNVPTINIGDRQKGRVRGKSVIDVRANKGEIDKAIKTILTKEYRSKLKDMRNPYYQEKSLEKAYQIIKEFLNSQNIKKLKEFYDL